MRKTIYSDKQKAQAEGLEAIKGEKTINQISSQYQARPTQIQRWKTIVAKGLPGLFSQNDQKDKKLADKEKLIDELYKIIGQRDTELDWLKKNLAFLTIEQRKQLIEKDSHQPRENPAADALDGLGSHLPEKKNEFCQQRKHGLPLPAPRSNH